MARARLPTSPSFAELPGLCALLGEMERRGYADDEIRAILRGWKRDLRARLKLRRPRRAR